MADSPPDIFIVLQAAAHLRLTLDVRERLRSQENTAADSLVHTLVEGGECRLRAVVRRVAAEFEQDYPELYARLGRTVDPDRLFAGGAEGIGITAPMLVNTIECFLELSREASRALEAGGSQ